MITLIRLAIILLAFNGVVLWARVIRDINRCATGQCKECNKIRKV